MKTEMVFELQQAQVNFHNQCVLDIEHLAIPKGVHCAIIGPNGAGKSTLLKGLLGQYGLQVRCNQQEINQVVKQGKIAWVGQHENFTVSLTVLDYVLLGRYPHISWFTRPSEQDNAEAKKWLEHFGLMSMANKRIQQLSGGEQQRAAIARAFLQNTEILLLDEPNNHLDIRHQHQLMQALKQHPQQEKLSCIMVLHDLSLAANYADYFILMHEGKVLKQGCKEDVLTHANLQAAYGWDITPMKMPSGAWGFDSFSVA